MSSTRHVMIAGGGIGGLAAALSIAGQGLHVSLFEQAEEFGEVGAGIQLSPNCTRVLFDLGLEDAIRACAFVPESSQIRAWNSGKQIASAPLGTDIEQIYGYPYLHVHRADLVAVLADAVRLSDRVEMYMGEPAGEFEQTGEPDNQAVRVSWRDKTIAGSALVGADGIRSGVRERLFGEQEPQFTGNVAFRALVPVSALSGAKVPPFAGLWWGPGAHFVHYYIRRGELLNCVCVLDDQDWCDESWMIPGDIDELRRAYRGWHSDIQTIINTMDPDTVFKWALNDREPLEQWGVGNVTLLGDACHPSLPYMAQGAAMAIEDGAVLARCLRMELPVAASLQRYEDRRRGRTAFIQRGSRRNARVYHLRGLPAFFRNLVASRAAAGTMHRLFSYDALSAHL